MTVNKTHSCSNKTTNTQEGSFNHYTHRLRSAQKTMAGN